MKEAQPDRFAARSRISWIQACVQPHLTAICCKRLAVETLLSLIIIHSLGFGLCLGRNHQKIKKLIFWNYNVSVHVNISALVITYPVQVNICNTDPHNCICILPVGLQAASAHLDCYENAHCSKTHRGYDHNDQCPMGPSPIKNWLVGIPEKRLKY